MDYLSTMRPITESDIQLIYKNTPNVKNESVFVINSTPKGTKLSYNILSPQFHDSIQLSLFTPIATNVVHNDITFFPTPELVTVSHPDTPPIAPTVQEIRTHLIFNINSSARSYEEEKERNSFK